jgi:hypothetical protein
MNTSCVQRNVLTEEEPNTTWKGGLHLLQAGLKPVQERGLRYQCIDEFSISESSFDK